MIGRDWLAARAPWRARVLNGRAPQETWWRAWTTLPLVTDQRFDFVEIDDETGNPVIGLRAAGTRPGRTPLLPPVKHERLPIRLHGHRSQRVRGPRPRRPRLPRQALPWRYVTDTDPDGIEHPVEAGKADAGGVRDRQAAYRPGRGTALERLHLVRGVGQGGTPSPRTVGRVGLPRSPGGRGHPAVRTDRLHLEGRHETRPNRDDGLVFNPRILSRAVYHAAADCPWRRRRACRCRRVASCRRVRRRRRRRGRPSLVVCDEAFVAC